MRAWLRGRDVGLGYAAIVLLVAVAVAGLPSRPARHFVIDSSTNLANLRSHPLYVLVVSAFVTWPLWQVLLVAPLVWACTELQRWLGRLAVVVVAALGHVGATLFVATVLSAGIAHGRVSLSQARGADVGVSYVLVTILGMLAARLPRRIVAWLVPGLTLLLAGLLLLDRGFTDLGHVIAWGIGLALAWLQLQAELRHPGR